MSTSTNSSFVKLSDILAESRCANITLSSSILYAFTGTRLLLVIPSSIFLLFLGHQQWRRQCLIKPLSHFDLFTYHLALIQLIWGLGTALFYGASHLPTVRLAGLYLMNIVFVGETFFHIFTCLDRYLAVVYPVTFKRSQNIHGVMIRNISTLFAWLFSFLWSHLTVIYYPKFPVIQFFCFQSFSMVMVSFCSFSVLRALSHPGPGKKDKDRKHVDQTKQRAFRTVLAITGVVFLWFLVFLIVTSLRESDVLGTGVSCLMHKSIVWFSLPSSLVLQLLYFHKKGKLKLSFPKKSCHA